MRINTKKNTRFSDKVSNEVDFTANGLHKRTPASVKVKSISIRKYELSLNERLLNQSVRYVAGSQRMALASVRFSPMSGAVTSTDSET